MILKMLNTLGLLVLVAGFIIFTIFLLNNHDDDDPMM